MLKQRIITALILIPIFVFLLLKLSTPAFCILTGFFVIWGAFEWSLFLGVTRFPHCFIFPLIVLVLLLVALVVPLPYVLYPAFAWWLLALLLVVLYPRAQMIWGKSLFLRALMGILVLVPCWVAVNFIRASENGSYVLLFLFVLIWGADSAAFFAGKRFGKHKLSPHVSPGKSWEGLLGALLMTVLIALGVLEWSKTPYPEWSYALLLTLVTVLFSVLGDLFESMLKRNVGLKDSGQLLPGHGGLLDRIDSLTAAAPVFAIGALWMGRIFQ